MINRQTFFDNIKKTLFKNGLTQTQTDTINSVIDECEKQGVTDLRQVAYIFATAAWEAYNPKIPSSRLTPIKEFGGEEYLKSKKYYPYFGRGLSQISWLDNYKKEGTRLGIDLVNNPDLMLDIPVACNSHVFCMKNGIYTGKKLSDYINEQKCDFFNARRIINGTNKADEIMALAQSFLAAMQ